MGKGSGRVGTWGTAIAIKDAQIANARLVLLIDSAPVSQLRPSMRDQRSPAVACPCPAAICAACHLRGRRGGRTGSARGAGKEDVAIERTGKCGGHQPFAPNFIATAIIADASRYTPRDEARGGEGRKDRKSTRLNSSH